MSSEEIQKNHGVKFSYKDAADVLNEMQHELSTIKQQFVKSRVECKILEVDLATQFNPHLVDVIRSSKQTCQKCSARVEKSYHGLKQTIVETAES